MKYVRIAPDLPGSSRLGFGCGSIMGRAGKAQSTRAIKAALDAGITHFDIAPLYGYGEAEALLGQAVRGRRDQLVIASKFGLAARRPVSTFRALKPIARSVIAAVPGFRSVVRGTVGTTTLAADRFSVASARASLERSLRALNTDYLDLLFLHDSGPHDLSDELRTFLEAQRLAGKIRAYGVASDIATIATMIDSFGDSFVYQFGNSLGLPHRHRLPRASRKFITYSPFAGAADLLSLLEARPNLCRMSHGRRLQPQDIYHLMLRYALSAPNVAVVLSSMIETDHLRRNLSAVDTPPFENEELADFDAAIGEALLQVSTDGTSDR